MAAKVVTCVICSEPVSRRQSLSLQPLTGEQGRACRHHEELKQLMRKRASEEELMDALKRAEDAVLKIAAVHLVRLMSFLHDMPHSVCYHRFKWGGMDPGLIDAIKTEVDELGPLSMEELESSFGYMMALRERL